MSPFAPNNNSYNSIFNRRSSFNQNGDRLIGHFGFDSPNLFDPHDSSELQASRRSSGARRRRNRPRRFGSDSDENVNNTMHVMSSSMYRQTSPKIDRDDTPRSGSRNGSVVGFFDNQSVGGHSNQSGPIAFERSDKSPSQRYFVF